MPINNLYLTVEVYVLSVHVYSGNLTHDLGVVRAIIYCWSYRNAKIKALAELRVNNLLTHFIIDSPAKKGFVASQCGGHESTASTAFILNGTVVIQMQHQHAMTHLKHIVHMHV